MPTIKNKPISVKKALDAVVGAPQFADDLRANEVSLRGDELKDYSIDLGDLDEAILYYLKEVIKPIIIQDGTRKVVPIMYGNPQRWKSSQLDGDLRDKDGQVMFPVIILKKDLIEKNLDYPTKLDGNKVNNYHIVQERYTSKNQYSNFSAMSNRKPVKSFRVISIPDYYNITYTCGVYVDIPRDLNTILESIMYAARSYWGDPERFRFMVLINEIPITQETGEGENRKVFAEFNIILSGYIIPDSLNHFISTQKKFFSKAQIVFNTQ